MSGHGLAQPSEPPETCGEWRGKQLGVHGVRIVSGCLTMERNAAAISQNVTSPLESTLMWPKVTYKAKIELQNYQQ